MTHFRPSTSFRYRALAIAVLFAHSLGTVGYPLIPRHAAVSDTIAYPCAGHACGCATSEQGWAGDCCCYTLEQKLAWADARGIEPPTHVRSTIAARKQAQQPKTKSCCASHDCEEPEPRTGLSESQSVRWINAQAAQKCRGQILDELNATSVCEFAVPVSVWRDTTCVEWLRTSHVPALAGFFRPPLPPPRVV